MEEPRKGIAQLNAAAGHAMQCKASKQPGTVSCLKRKGADLSI